MKKKEKRKLAKKKTVPGMYLCSSCGHELFDSAKEYDSGTGFPSFWMHIKDHVKENFLDTYGRERIQLLCNNCGQHLGHLFDNKHTPTQRRYCINSQSIHWKKVKH